MLSEFRNTESFKVLREVRSPSIHEYSRRLLELLIRISREPLNGANITLIVTVK